MSGGEGREFVRRNRGVIVIHRDRQADAQCLLIFIVYLLNIIY